MKKGSDLVRMRRTDLALECRERLGEHLPDGVTVEETAGEGVNLTKIEVHTKAAALALGKPVGVYYTASMEGFPGSDALTDDRLSFLVEALRALVPPAGGVLVAGLGNRAVTPDAVGPKCADAVLATRHIDKAAVRALSLPRLREVSVISPGVTGQTGMEAAETVAAVCEKIKPACVIAVDALAAAGAGRLAKTVQLSSAGIEPGSGVGNARKALNRETLGVPVISVGVPTVVDALTLAGDAYGETDPPPEAQTLAGMMVTPRDIDTVIDGAARLLALAVNCALQKNMTPAELLGLM